MVIRGSNHCYPNGSQNYGVSEESIDPNSSTHRTSFIYNFSILKEKVEQVESLASSIFIPPHHPDDQMAMDTLIQEIIVTASSMMFACQHMSLNNAALAPPAASAVAEESGPSTAFFATHQDTVDHWYKYNNKEDGYQKEPPRGGTGETAPVKEYDVVEVEAADLLAKYTHYCQVCGKGFKRDANLRMHMRAHGEEYKSSAALSNPMKSGGGGAVPPRKYSCPQEGCRWNKKHARFQPLKSMICVKNHYKRSHCPKMYVCKRCNRKQFSVLSDLRTHEKHCGDLKWQCSCGTTFSRKDKLMGHVALFVGHSPVFI